MRSAIAGFSLLLSVGIAGLAIPTVASATEGALGRPITGVQITPYVGIIPATPGMQWSMGYVHYHGAIGAEREVPIAGQVSLGLKAKLDLYTLTGVYIWPTGEGRWNFASMGTVPYIAPDVTAALQLGPAQRRVHQSASGLYDLYFAPVIASYHVSEVQHLSLGLYVYAPTAKYDADRIANPGLNIWTFSPGVGYTQLFQQGTLEFSMLAAIDFYTKNDDTGYKNGMVWRLDSLLVKRTASGWGLGAAAGWIQQLEKDSGANSDRLNGFKGRSFGVGPVISYAKHWESGAHLDVSLRYLKEFDVKNRFDGEPLSLMASIGF